MPFDKGRVSSAQVWITFNPSLTDIGAYCRAVTLLAVVARELAVLFDDLSEVYITTKGAFYRTNVSTQAIRC